MSTTVEILLLCWESIVVSLNFDLQIQAHNYYIQKQEKQIVFREKNSTQYNISILRSGWECFVMFSTAYIVFSLIYLNILSVNADNKHALKLRLSQTCSQR